MNLNSRSSLDPRWTTHHVKVAVGFMLASIRVIRKDPDAVQTYDQNTGLWSTDGFTVVFVGMARIQPYGIIGDQIVGQDATGRRLMRVQIESKDTGINLDDMLIVDSCPDDPELELFSMEVRGSIGSSNAWVTDLVCEADLKHLEIANDLLMYTVTVDVEADPDVALFSFPDLLTDPNDDDILLLPLED
jgi:hypothetical protein